LLFEFAALGTAVPHSIFAFCICSIIASFKKYQILGENDEYTDEHQFQRALGIVSTLVSIAHLREGERSVGRVLRVLWCIRQELQIIWAGEQK